MSVISRYLKKIRLVPRLSSRFHISMGLSSLLGSVVLLSIYLGLVPDRQANLALARASLSEAVATLSSVLLRTGDVSGIRYSLQFIADQNPGMHSIVLTRNSDKSQFEFTSELVNTKRADVLLTAPFELIQVPILRGNQEWGRLKFQFYSSKHDGLFSYYKDSPFVLIMFVGLVSFPLFYLFLGKMLKELNPSTAVPSRVRSALDTIAGALLVVDTRGNVVLANLAFAELTGQSSESLLGIAASSLPWSSPDSGTQNVWESALLLAEPTRHDKIGFVDVNKKLRTFIVNCSPVLGAGDKAGGVLISMDDITVLQEQELLLRESIEIAEQANLAKSTFLSTMSHEIRTPMTAILGFTDVLKRGLQQSEADRQKYLNTISNSGHHLLELINDVLDLSKVESGAIEVEALDCDWASIVNEVVHTLRVKAEQKAISLDLEIATDIPQIIISDPSRLRQIITNLVGNAIKFTEHGGVRIQLSFECSEFVEKNNVFVRVIDSGIGMTQEQQATIFEAFTQADATITRRFGGTGLGLSISRELTIAMGGVLEVSSEMGVGSTFHVVLPISENVLDLKKPQEILAGLNSVSQQSETKWIIPSSRILVVDDGKENRQLLSVVLSDLNLDVSMAENGQQALDIIETEGFDVVLMDIQMPIMDGFEAAERMRSSGVVIPIVALTANAMKGFEAKILSAGFSHYMTKPIDLDKLAELLAQLLGGEKNHQQMPQTDSVPSEGIAINEIVALDKTTEIVSPFLGKDQRYVEIVQEFKQRLAERIEEIELAIGSSNWVQLAELGHWLKGSAAMLGINELVEPGTHLENAAKAHSLEQCKVQCSIVKSMQKRIVTSTGREDEQSNLQKNTIRSRSDIGSLPIDMVNEVTDLPNNDSDEVAFADNVVRSTLPVDQADFFCIVDEFVKKLHEQRERLREAVLLKDFASIAELAHWLRGSGGNMGFAGFMPLADMLEQSAVAQNESVTLHFSNMDDFIGRVIESWAFAQDQQRSA